MAGVNIYKNEKQTGGTIYEILACLTTCLFDNEVYQNILTQSTLITVSQITVNPFRTKNSLNLMIE